ncbi:MAG: flagella basal body P-ring formation protein FlgA [Erythrobacter sp.]|jgi:flagella basal body P-ring formation protein FlgA|nr:flagella basal body P-ring formation protein FlgA [Erythrobacter sp.]
MTSLTPRRCLATAGALVLGTLPAFAQTTSPHALDPAAIDRAVAAFTGAPVGAVGGALQPADPRLRLAACPVPLALGWHGQAGAVVRVACEAEGSRGWQIFVAIKTAALPGSSSASAARQAPREAPQVKRGDPITVLVRGKGFSVQQAGEASETGRVGDWIGVRTAQGKQPVRARLEQPGLAIIELR